MSLPRLPDPFYWRDEAWGPALRCAALDGLAEHCFTTRGLPVPGPAAATLVAATLGVAGGAIVTARQVHGKDVVVVRRGRAPAWPAPGDECAADVLVSDDPQRAVLVRAADCAPVLLADRRTGAVAAVHAGWRGTCAGAAPAAVEALGREWGSRPRDLVAAIGPAIGPCCYEVGTELVDAFAAAGHPRHLIDRWFQARPPARGQTTVPPLRLDVPGANRDQLEMAGVPADQIHVAGLCTAEHLELLTSYRAEKEGAGRLAGVIRARGAGERAA
jgi:YfiH family protein